MNTKMNRLAKQVILGVTALCLMAYAAIQISLTVGDIVEVENAVYTRAYRSVPADAYIFRDEMPILRSESGTACYFFSEGEKVQKGAEILRIYTLDADAKVQDEINLLEKRIAVLEKSSVDKTYSTTDLQAFDTAIAAKINGIIASVSDRNLTMASLNEDELLILMNRRSSVIAATGGYDYVIDLYQKRISELKETLSGTFSVVTSESAGYFYSSADGYENMFTVQLLNDLTLEEYHTLESRLPDETLINRAKGKMVLSSKWYITVCLNKKVLSRLTEGKSPAYRYEIKLPYSGGEIITARLENIVSQTNYETAVAVFSCDTQNDRLNYTRAQPVEIITEHYDGLKIPLSSIRVVDGVTGVYTLNGTVVRFKEASVLSEGNGYCICVLPFPGDPNRLSPGALSLYDPVITSGVGLYEGKIIK